MAYRVRSRYTPGGGVLAFFEQVSRFVSLSVAFWIGVSLFLILFSSDSKVTDSFDLRLMHGIFTDGQIFLTAVILISCSGLMGAFISLPASIVLLLSRQYLDFQLNRSSRRNNYFRLQIVKNIPVAVLLLSHFLVFSVNLASAPQLAKTWFREGSKVSEALAGGHFVLASATRRASFDVNLKVGANEGAANSLTPAEAKRVHFIFVPADQMESDDFLSEMSKIPGTTRLPFVMPRSSIIDQVDFMLREIKGATAHLARQALLNAKDYSKIVVKNNSQAIVSVSPQIRFGHHLAGHGTELVAGFSPQLFNVEAQRRLVLSQRQLFGIFRVMDGVQFLNPVLNWLNLVGDDVFRLRLMATKNLQLNQNQNSIAILQLSGMEREFTSVNNPFRPIGWSFQEKSYEARIVNKNIVRELAQYLNDIRGRDSAYWVVLPYADDRRSHPRSFAFLSSRFDLAKDSERFSNSFLGVLSEDVSKEVSKFLSEEEVLLPSDRESIERLPKIVANQGSGARLTCFETEVDFAEADFKFQAVEIRERNLGQLLNSLPVMPDSDLKFLGRSMSSLVTRELGLGFVCRAQSSEMNETFLLKFRDSNSWNLTQRGIKVRNSVFLNKALSRSSRSDGSTKQKMNDANTPQQSFEQGIKAEVLREFVVLQLVSDGRDGRLNSSWNWRRLDERESESFFAKFQVDTLQAIEISARARIR